MSPTTTFPRTRLAPLRTTMRLRQLIPMRPVYINWGICCPPLPCSGIDSDIASSDTYPIPSQSPANIGVWAAADAATGKLSWMWLQASGYAYSVPRDPTGPEEDCMV